MPEHISIKVYIKKTLDSFSFSGVSGNSFKNMPFAQIMSLHSLVLTYSCENIIDNAQAASVYFLSCLFQSVDTFDVSQTAVHVRVATQKS